MGSPGTGKSYISFADLGLGTVFPARKLTPNYYLHICFLEIWQFNHRLVPPLLDTCHKYYPQLLTKYEEGKGTSKILIFQLLK